MSIACHCKFIDGVLEQAKSILIVAFELTAHLLLDNIVTYEFML
jgi:hypothetical protein